MHEDTSHNDRFWNLVAAYIDGRDLTALRRDWPTATFMDVAIHVTSCVPCLERRLVKLKEWSAPPVPAKDVN